MNQPLWEVNKEDFKKTDLYRLKVNLEKKFHLSFSNYTDLWQWSVANKKEFWSELWDFFKIVGTKGSLILENEHHFLESKWFPEAQLNFAENLLKPLLDPDHHKNLHEEVLVFWSEDKVKISLTKMELLNLVSRTAQALSAAGLVKGDRVCAMVPNHPLTIVCMLATTSLGGIWSSCSPDFGVQGVLDRFSQIAPKIFIACNYYFYGGKKIDCLEKAKEISKSLPTVTQTLVIDVLGDRAGQADLDDDKVTSISEKSRLINFAEFIKTFSPQKIFFTQVEFNHPLYILYSSGTTGIPKCIVHGHGGTLLQHLKEHRLHADIRPRDVVFYFTTCGWMMWNWLVSALASDAKILLYDGSPFFNEGKILFELAQTYACTHFGTSAKFIDACLKTNLNPKSLFKLDSLRVILSTGSPLSADGFDYVYQKISETAQLASISGGTDIISCFVLGSPWTDVYRGEISVPGLGMDIDVWDENKNSLFEKKGELVCKSTFPSKPIEFWNDPTKEKFRKAYFDKYDNIWCHGDFVERTTHQGHYGFIIHGRSDATLNPGGVRIGTAEIYRQVDLLEEVEESIVIGQDWQGDVRVVLFVKLRNHLLLDLALVEKIKKQIRNNTTPRHVPSKILQVTEIPRTKSGKIVELAVKQTVQGEVVKNTEALANPEALNQFKNRAELSV
ncbi:MAG: acetoacetate--CoA ligase [Deltaproteobacteria bacterium]|nr:acetoacetate--CoA ligase [Deltaproteobacteria bacterium]